MERYHIGRIADCTPAEEGTFVFVAVEAVSYNCATENFADGIAGMGMRYEWVGEKFPYALAALLEFLFFAC